MVSNVRLRGVFSSLCVGYLYVIDIYIDKKKFNKVKKRERKNVCERIDKYADGDF